VCVCVFVNKPASYIDLHIFSIQDYGNIAWIWQGLGGISIPVISFLCYMLPSFWMAVVGAILLNIVITKITNVYYVDAVWKVYFMNGLFYGSYIASCGAFFTKIIFCIISSIFSLSFPSGSFIIHSFFVIFAWFLNDIIADISMLNVVSFFILNCFYVISVGLTVTTDPGVVPMGKDLSKLDEVGVCCFV